MLGCVVVVVLCVFISLHKKAFKKNHTRQKTDYASRLPLPCQHARLHYYVLLPFLVVLLECVYVLFLWFVVFVFLFVFFVVVVCACVCLLLCCC